MSSARMATLAVAIFLTFGLSCTPAQRDVELNLRENIRQINDRKARLTGDEKKLDSGLYEVMRLAEEADTSVQKAEQLRLTLARSKLLATDSLDRIQVAIDLTSVSTSNQIVSRIKSLDGEVIMVGSTPYVICRIHPKKLRSLTTEDGVRRITYVVPGELN